MPRRLALLVLLILAVPSPAAPPRLTPAEVEAGWIELFDGETTFGWQATGKDAKLDVKDGVLTLTAEAEDATATYVGPTLSAFEFVVE